MSAKQYKGAGEDAWKNRTEKVVSGHSWREMHVTLLDINAIIDLFVGRLSPGSYLR